MFDRDIDNLGMPLSVMFDRWPRAASVFLAHGMLCFGCPIRPFHTVIDACHEYVLDETRFRRDLRVTIETQEICGPVAL